jgi:Helicase associated domain
LSLLFYVFGGSSQDLRYAELLQYKAEHGDCKVPQHYKPNKALGKWVAKQREQYKLLQKKQHSFLTPYRQEKLNTAGFVWVVRAGMDTDAVAAAAAAAAVTTPRAKSEGGDDEDAAAAGAAGTASDAGKITASDFPTDAAAAAEGEEDAVKVDPEAMEQEEKEAETKEVYNV